jgi:putative transposase
MIERTHPKLSVGAQCRVLSISRSSIYYAPQGENALNIDLMLLIDKPFLETPFYAMRRKRWLNPVWVSACQFMECPGHEVVDA